MDWKTSLIASLWILWQATEVVAIDWPDTVPLDVGGRFEYVIRSDENASFPWNSAAPLGDGTRLMLDLSALGTPYGNLYLKGAASWKRGWRDGTEKQFRFEQGDYLWGQIFGRLDYSLRLFANERRFFTRDVASPLLDDDVVTSGRENRGVRADAALGDHVEITALFSTLGGDVDDSRRVAYVRLARPWRPVHMSVSYLYDDIGSGALSRHAVFKTELAGAYRRAALFLSYEQSGLRGDGIFFPGGSFHWERFDGDNFSSILPAEGAFSAEARIAPLRLGAAGDLKFVTRYRSVGPEFFNDLARGGTPQVDYSTAAYFLSRTLSLNARVVYENSVRLRFEDEETDRLEGAVWGGLRNGVELFARGGIGRIAEANAPETEQNFLHGALIYDVRKVRSGIHVMFEDVGTDFSDIRFAWEGKFVVGPELGVHVRLVLDDGMETSDAVFARLDFRPSNRLFLYASYGRSYIGDGPYLLEDKDIGLTESAAPTYSISIRGDF